MSRPISESEFYMWRTLFAVSHADEVVTNEEVRFMAEAMADVAFSDEQRAILNDDVRHPKDIMEMFAGITDPVYQARFFKHARKLVHIDGDYGDDEQAIMLQLGRLHVKKVNIDDLVGKTGLELEEEADWAASAKRMVFSFREMFLNTLQGRKKK